jgi:glycosyltransferase involved in cell wall biosynthesis
MTASLAASKPPVISVVTPVYNPPLDVLDATITSVVDQEFRRWELILVDDCSPDPAVRDLLRRRAEGDPRIKVVERETNGHIVAASNDGIRAARGEFVALLDHDDLLAPQALKRNVEMIRRFDDVDYLYSDEDKIDDTGRHYDTFRKPSWSPERLRGQMYTGHLSVIRTSVVREIGGFREGYDGSQDHDLILRVGEVARRVVHIPEILYHWRVVPGSAAGDPNAKPYATIAGRKAVQDHIDRIGIAGEVTHGPVPGIYHIARRLDPSIPVSLVIPTIGKDDLVWGKRRVFVVEAVRSFLAATDHPAVEVVVVYDEPTPPDVLDALRDIAGDRLTLVPFSGPFNYSRKMNLGVLHSRGRFLVLLNDDMEAITHGWLEQLVAPLLEPDVGMTGAKLYFGNDTVQHAGHAYARKNYKHPFIFEPRGSFGPFGALVLNREASGVTAACAGIRRDVFMEVGGFCEALPLNFNDVDLSCKVRRSGRRIVWLANVEAYHFESRSRLRVVEAWEKDLTVDRWGMPRHDELLPQWWEGTPRRLVETEPRRRPGQGGRGRRSTGGTRASRDRAGVRGR